MKFELLLLAMLILVTNSSTDVTACTNIKVGHRDDVCYNVNLDSGYYCCLKKEEKLTGENRTCVVLNTKDKDTLQPEAEKILKEKNLEEFKYNCGDGPIVAQSAEKKKSEALKEICESKENPVKGDDCKTQFNSSVINDGYHCCYWYLKKGSEEEKECTRVPKYYYENLKTFVSEEVKGNDLDELEIDCGTDYKLVTSDSSGNAVETVSGKTSGACLLKTGVIISIFVLLI